MCHLHSAVDYRLVALVLDWKRQRLKTATYCRLTVIEPCSGERFPAEDWHHVRASTRAAIVCQGYFLPKGKWLCTLRAEIFLFHGRHFQIPSGSIKSTSSPPSLPQLLPSNLKCPFECTFMSFLLFGALVSFFLFSAHKSIHIPSAAAGGTKIMQQNNSQGLSVNEKAVPKQLMSQERGASWISFWIKITNRTLNIHITSFYRNTRHNLKLPIYFWKKRTIRPQWRQVEIMYKEEA